MSILIGEKEYFKGIGKIQYEGLESDNHLRFVGTMNIVWLPEKA